MNINLSLAGTGRGDGPGVAKQSREDDKAAAAVPFGGLFAGLQEAAAAVADERANPAREASGEAATQPDLPIWPTMVEEGLPKDPVEASGLEADADAIAGGEGLVAADDLPVAADAAAASPNLAAPASGSAPQAVEAVPAAELATGDAPLSSATVADAAADPAVTGIPPRDLAAARSGGTDTRPVDAAQVPAPGPVPAGAVGDSEPQVASLVQAAAMPSERGAERSSRNSSPAGRGDPPPAGAGAQVVRQAEAGTSWASNAQAAAAIQLPETASAKAVAQVSQLGPADLPDVASRIAERHAPLADAGRSATGLDALALNTSPLSAAAGTRGADGMVMPGGAQQAPVPAGQLAQHATGVIRQMGGGRSEARIELHPAELGQLDLELRQDGQKLELSVTVDNEQTRRLVQDQLAQWRERLADAGMDLHSLDVEVRDQQGTGRQDSDAGEERSAEVDEQDVNNPTALRVSHGDRALDLYA